VKTRPWFKSLRELYRLTHWLTPSVLSWTEASLRQLRKDLPAVGLRARAPEPPDAPAELGGAVALWLRLRRATCLERSLILQRWCAARGRQHDLLIGVGLPSDGEFVAHAWLEGEDAQGHEILARVTPSGTLS